MNGWITSPEVARVIEDMQRQRAEVELQTAQVQLATAQLQEQRARNEAKTSEIALDCAIKASKHESTSARAGRHVFR